MAQSFLVDISVQVHIILYHYAKLLYSFLVSAGDLLFDHTVLV